MPFKKSNKQLFQKVQQIIDNNYVDETQLDYMQDEDSFQNDITMFCVKKKFERDQKVYGKPRATFFDNKKEIKKK